MESSTKEESRHSRFKQQIREWLQSKPVGQAFQPAGHYPELRHFNREDAAAVSFYRRRLPHWQVEGSTYFITYRVTGHLTWSLVEHISETGFVPASIVEESLFFSNGDRFLLDAYVIMPDHVHLLIRPITGWSLAAILRGLKGFSAWEINRTLKRHGSVWQAESFDHLIRNNADWLDKFDYIHNNPMKAGLVSRPQDYPFSSLVTLHSIGRLESLPSRGADELITARWGGLSSPPCPG